jgi:SAM-dependent methyltransferase
MTFKDHFSVQAADYAKFRPRYPAKLFVYLAHLTPERKLAWDCATGNGQAAVELAAHFERVIATDASAKQIEEAEQHPHITYAVGAAEKSDLQSESCDLVSVAQALHWLDLKRFYAEAKRVLKEGAILAVWNYNLLQITPEIDAVVNHFYNNVVGPFWPPERRLIECGYGALPFPFEEIDVPSFAMTAVWSLEALLGYLRTWSATQRYVEATGQDPLGPLHDQLRDLWPVPGKELSVSWPLSVRAGRHSG